MREPSIVGVAPQVVRAFPGPLLPEGLSSVSYDLALLREAFGAPDVREATWRALLDASRLVRCEEGDLRLSSPRRPEPSWWLIRQGLVGLGERTESGRFVERRRLDSGEWLDVAGAMSAPGTWLEAMYCHTEVELLAVPLEALFAACLDDPALIIAFGGVLARRLRTP